MRHVAIIHPEYLALILAGRKRAEVRLARNRCAPFARVSPGDVLYFKARSGGFGARAIVSSVDEFEHLTPPLIAMLFRRYNAMACGDAAYWISKQHARFGTIVHLTDVRSIERGPEYRAAPGFSPRSSWIVLRRAARRRAS
ncbi:MAG: ASCH domain-containing protein [Phycisphaerales bacterium]